MQVNSYFADNAPIIGWRDQDVETVKVVQPWKPEALAHEQWPPNYKAVYAWRIKQLEILRSDPEILRSAKAYYSTRPDEFIMHWMDTYNPRKKNGKWMPFVFFERQGEFIRFLHDLRDDDQSGLIEKCRDAGATWCSCAYSIWSLIFVPDDAIGWGSRKQDLVDKLGNPDSIFEKMRLILKRMPDVFLPNYEATFMRIINRENGSVIMGEAGDNIGRGGRTSMYFKDEAQPLTAGVLTPFGWQTMGDMRVGSLVCVPGGGWRSVTHVNDAGMHDVYRVTLSDGSKTDCSTNHLWNVEKVIGKREKLTLRTIEIAENLFYESPNGQKLFRYRLPTVKPVEFIGRGNYPIHPYVVGVLIGDGSINSGAITFTSADEEIFENVKTRLPNGCKVSKGAGSYDYLISDSVRYNKNSRAKNAVKAAGIYGNLAHEKSIPEMYLFGSVQDRIELLQGLMDTDGSASGGTCTYHTCSKELAENVRFIVQSLGGSASLNVKPDRRGYRDMYCLHVTLPVEFDFFKIARKNNAVNSRKRAFGKTIVSVQKIGREPVRCITVDSEDGLYITDDCMVTHNSAHYERPEKIEAALGDNTNTQIDISSVNGLGNVFHRRREAGVEWQPGKEIEKGYTQVFVIDWRDHPEKTQAWYDNRKAKYEREGMLHIFAQEVDRNYSAAVQNTIIPYDWIVACVDAHKKIKWKDDKGNIRTGFEEKDIPNKWLGGLDVADEGADRNARALRQWIIWRDVEEWGERDTGVTTRKMVAGCRAYKGIKVQYDVIGVGSGVKAEFNRLVEEKIVDRGVINLFPWNAGAGVVNPYERIIPDDDESPMNKDLYGNMKAQAWWSIRSRFYKTFKNITEGILYPVDELISLDSNMTLLHQLMKELAQPTRGENGSLRTIVNKKPAGMKSPNLADAGIMMFFPIEDNTGHAVSGNYGA